MPPVPAMDTLLRRRPLCRACWIRSVSFYQSPTFPALFHNCESLSLLQTWDLLESPAFSTVYREAVDTCFRHVFDTLYKTVFSPQGQTPTSAHALRAPPLASLLPQIKSIATNLLPTVGAGGEGEKDSFGMVSAVVKELSSGPYLESFCIAILDTVI